MTAISNRRLGVDIDRVLDGWDRLTAALSRHRASLIWLMPVLAVAATVSFINLGGAPQRIDDEGTYTAQAWAVGALGELAHYTFWYDHPPVGWLQLAGWTWLTGGFARYDIAVLAAREAVVVASLVSVVLVWLLARRLHLSRPAAAGAALVFALSPLALQFHRTVYLDNVATPWLLAAFLFALSRRNQLAGFAASAVSFGIAVLSKETFLLMLPFLVWVMVRGAQKQTRRYTLAVAGSILVLIGGSYLLLATVKGELAPGANRVSLIDGVLFQLASRDGSGSLADPDSLISRTLGMWWDLDPVLIVAGVVAAAVGVTIRALRPFAIMVLFLVAFMFRPGGYLPVPYVIALLPFAALLVAGVTDAAVRRLRRRAYSRPHRVAGIAWTAGIAAAVIAVVPLWGAQLRGFLLADLDAPMSDAQSWLEANVERDQRLIVDDAMWVDLVDAGWNRDNVVWYYKVDTDPAVQALSPNGWRDADYVITTNSMRTFPDGFPQVQQAIDNSVIVAAFGENDQAVEVRRIVASGAEAAETAEAASAAQSVRAGTELAGNPAITVGDSDRDLLTGGALDPRLPIALGALTPDWDVTVGGFPAVDGEDGRPLRQILVTEIDGAPAVVDGRPSPAADSLGSSLTGDFAPERVTAARDGLLLTFPVAVAALPAR